MGDIGKPEKEIEFEPLEEPLTVPTTTPAPEKTEPVTVPA